MSKSMISITVNTSISCRVLCVPDPGQRQGLPGNDLKKE